MAEFLNLIQKYLLRLAACIDDNEIETKRVNAGVAVDLVNSIHQAFQNYSLKENDKASICSHVFSESYGLLAFLKAIILTGAECKHLKVESFKLLDDFLHLVSTAAVMYGPEIKDVCMTYIKRESAANVKAAAMVTLSKVLEMCHTLSESDDMNVKKLIEDLYFQLSLGTKLASTVKESVLCLLGVVSHYYPESFISYSDRMLTVFLQEMKKQMDSRAKKADLSIISGCLLGLKEYLFNFSVSYTEDMDKSYKIFDCVKRAIQAGTKNYTICKAGMQLLSAHASQFGIFLFESYEELYQIIRTHVASTNREMQKVSLATAVSFLKQIGELLPEKIKENRQFAIKVFNFFMEDFKNTFSKEANTKQLTIAAVGYGLFAGACKLLIDEKEVKKMMYNIIQRSEHAFFSETHDLDDIITMLPAFLEALSSIAAEIENIPETLLFSLEKLVAFQIENFPHVLSVHQYLVCQALIKVFLVLQPKVEVFRGFLSRTVYQGLVRTFSHALVVDVEARSDEKSEEFIVQNPRVKLITYKNYLYLWSTMLNVVQWKELNAIGVPLSERQSLKEALYDEVINSILSLYHKLDLSTSNPYALNEPEAFEEMTDENVSSDPVHAIRPNNLQDCRIFINLVDFCRDFLISNSVELFDKWVYTFGRETIYYSTKHPFISGFYKLVALTLNICSKINYFKDLSTGDENSPDTLDEAEKKKACDCSFHLFSKFSKELVVRLQQFKDDLLASCLLVLLALPTRIIENELHVLIPVLQSTFKLGLSYLPLASVGMKTLERWCQEIPSATMKKFYPDILPLLNPYLLASIHKGESTSEKISKPSITASRKGHKMSTKYVKAPSNKAVHASIAQETELMKIQLQIVQFLGSLGGEHNKAMLDHAFEKAEAVAIAWDFSNRQHLSYAVPFVDMKPEIYFDDFLPHVLELATASSDRQIKVAACEVLHSLVLYIIGRGSQIPENRHQKVSMEELYKHFFPGLLKLACDVDQVVKQLFHPLVLQLTHWFTHRKTIETPESQIILLSLWDGATDPDSAAIRDFSSLCLKEYFIWAIKQSNKKEDVAVKNILKKMNSFALHPSPFKRMGAALVFNNLYTVFRNEETLVKQFTIELLVQFVESLAIAHSDDKFLGTQKLCLEALDHIRRICIVKANCFLTSSANRRKPVCLEEADMKSVVSWLFSQCGCIQIECRHKCMELVKKLAPLVPGVNNASEFLKIFLMDQNIYKSIYERRLIDLGVPPSQELQFSWNLPVMWLEALMCSLECYNWALIENLLVGDEENLIQNCRVFDGISFFIREIICRSLQSVVHHFSKHDIENEAFSPKEVMEYNWTKCTVLIRLFTFLITLCNNGKHPLSKKFFETLWNKHLWEVILLSVLDPASLGFDTTDSSVCTNLAAEMAQVLQSSKCQEDDDFKQYCSQYLSSTEKYNIMHYFPINFSSMDTDCIHLSELLSGYKLLVDADLWLNESEIFQKESLVEKLFECLWNYFLGSSDLTYSEVSLSPLAFNLAIHVLSFCDSLGIKAELLTSKLLDSVPVISSSSKKYVARRGAVIFSHFESKLSQVMCKIANPVITLLVSHMASQGFDALSILVKFLSRVAITKELRKKYGKLILETMLHCWSTLTLWWNTHTDADGLDSSLSVLTNMILLDSDVAVNTSGKFTKSIFSTYIDLLRRSEAPLDFKVHALDLLPFFTDVSHDEEHALKNCLDMLIINYFPTESKELSVGSFQYNTYVSAVKKFLSALELTGSCLILEVLTVLFCKEEKHIMQDQFEGCLNSLIKNLPPHKHQRLVEVAFKLTKPGPGSFSPTMQFAIIDRVCLPLLRKLSLSAFTNFFISNIQFIMETLKQRKSYNVEARRVQIIAKINASKLTEVLYSRLSKDQLHSVESQIVHAYVGCKPSKGNELTTDVIKVSLEFKKENVESEAALVELSRILHCAFFNTVIAVVSCTQTEIKFYDCFVFKENISKGERLWEIIVDPLKEYKFDIEFDEAITRKKQFVSIRHKVRSNSTENNDSTEKEVESSFHMMASHELAMSSLAEDISKFDFSTTEQVFSSKKSVSSSHQTLPSEEKESNDDFIEMEADELNLHDCMTPLSLLFRHMYANKLIPKESDKFPNWMESIISNLKDENMSKNVKLFLARVIINNAEILKVYGKYLFQPLMNLIVSGSLGADLNYFILDIIISMLSWAPDVIPENNPVHRHDATCVLEFLVRNCGHTRRDIFRNNLEVIKTLLECWKDRLDVPYSAIYDQMKNQDPANKGNIVGIQLLGVVLLNNLPPYPLGCETAGHSYLNLLLANLNNKFKEVYASSSEVIGLVLKYKIEKDSKLHDDPFYTKVIEKLTRTHHDERDKFLVCLHIIHRYCPDIACRFVPKLLYMQPSVHGIYQSYVLDLLCSSIDKIEDGYSQLKCIGIFEQIEHKEETLQYILLQTLEKVCSTLSCDEILHLLPVIVPLHSQPAVQCRLVLYRILMTLYNKYRDNDGAKEKEITRLSQETLLRALADSDSSLRLTVDNFWSSEKHLPVSTKERLTALMKNMYSPPTEDSFLQYATFLLLERTSHSPDYKRKIFEHPLSECNFLAYNITTSWRQRFAVMTPLFVDSASNSLSSSFDGSHLSSLEKNEHFVRATQQQADFSATHDTSLRSSTFNWLTDKSVDTFEDWGSTDSSFGISSSTKSHLLAVKKGKSQDAQKPCEKLDDRQSIKDKKGKSSVWLLKRRFLKDKSSDANVFARRELRRKDVREDLQKEQKKRREAEVTMYRQYRIGELPDIEIPNSAIIAPLQALAQNDPVIAKMLFKSLVVAICKYIEIEEPGMYHCYADEIQKCLCSILKRSVEYIPAVISFCLESLYSIGDLTVDADDIYVSCLRSNQQSIGILLLESKILKYHERDEEPVRKKLKSIQKPVAEKTVQWIKLAGLHKSVHDYDTCNGIFSHIMGGRKLNQKALELEANGQYAEAVKLYEKLFEETEEHDQAEKDFWDSSILFCYDHLSQWQSLEEISVSRFTDQDPPVLQKIWEDPYFIDNYLPYMMRSKVKRLIEGLEDQSLLTFIDASCTDEEKKTHLEEHFAEELSLLYIIQENFDGARYYTSTCLQKFLKEWRSLSSLAVSVQQSKIQNLQKYVEQGEFLEMVKKDGLCQPESIENQIKIWEKRLPSILDPPNIWDDVVANRLLYLTKLKMKYGEIGSSLCRTSNQSQEQNDSEAMEVDDRDVQMFYLEHSTLLKLSYVEYCTIQDNIPVALRHLKSIHKDTKKLNESYWSKFIGAYCLTNYHKAKKLCGEEKLEVLLNSMTQLAKVQAKCCLTLCQRILQSEMLEFIFEIFANHEVSLSEIQAVNRAKIMELMECEVEKEVLPNLHVKSFNCLKDAVLNASNHNSRVDYESVSKAFMSLANFCNRYLRQLDTDESSVESSWCGEYPKVLVESLLLALERGYFQAMQLFPRLLQVIEVYPHVLPVFVEKTMKIPCWLFLGWVNQMVAILDKPEAPAVQNIVQSIAHQYPNAIVYCFRLSCESYNFSDNSIGKKNKAFVDRIKKVLEKNRLISNFVMALDHLSVPSVIFKDYMVNICGYLPYRNQKTNEILACFHEMWDELFAISERQESTVPIGPIQRKFAKEFSKDIVKICGKDGKRLLTVEKEVVRDEFMNVYNKMKKAAVEKCELKYLSPWLSEFQPWKYDTQIEIPGQYMGKSKPLPEYHVKIAGFDEKVLILSSITQPRRITIRGNDEKEYKILVKAGEDLRQDSRIQQLFAVMNDIYSSDSQCGNQHLKLVTYKVIPISSRLGLIEWLGNTVVLNEFLMNSMTEREKKAFCRSDYKDICKENITKWGGGGHKSPNMLYRAIHEKKGREESIKKYEELVKVVPYGLLKRAFLKLSSSPEAFVRLRSQFAMSHAVICISQWLLGIGDRHLGNFLIDVTSGEEVGIDFGHAFGSATQFLQLPELVPFRLTPQYLQLMEPLREKGIIEATMIHALSALCKNNYLLLNIMDIFIKEPTLNWKAYATKQQQTVQMTDEEVKSDANWYPKERVQIAMSKLQGANPCHIMRKELQLGHGGDLLFEKFEYVCIGDPNHNVRAKLNSSQLTVEQQVSCLIDHATDPHVLCKTYYGWNPWM